MRPLHTTLTGALFLSAIALGLSACGAAVHDEAAAGGGSGAGGSGGEVANGGSRGGSGGRTGQGGAATGGAIGRGGAIGAGGASSGGSGAIMGGCCALLACPPGEKLLQSGAPCPAGVECYDTLSCCERVRCARPLVTCGAVPTCDVGDREITGACPPSLTCYSRALCGTTINCVSASGGGGGAGGGGAAGGGEAGAGCDPAAEYNRHYVATSRSTCALIDFGCPTSTQGFANDCGCGCEQPAACPEWVDCMPGPGAMSALCSDSSACPYTTRAL